VPIVGIGQQRLGGLDVIAGEFSAGGLQSPGPEDRLANCGADGWAMTPSGASGVLNDAAAVYFADPTIASAFVARWCAEFWHRQALPQTGRHQLSTIGSRQLGCLH
jgi:hypothetical protein